MNYFDRDMRDEITLGTANLAVGMYGGFIGIALMLFACYNISLMLSNNTSNETIRSRWNVQN